MKDNINLFISTWYVWVLIIFAVIIRRYMPIVKGFFGEKSVSFFLSMLDKNKYRIINDLMVDIEGKTSQIDHVVVSNYGIFVIETKNYKGWILGDENSQYWTQVIYKRKEKLYNPIKQNYGHVKALKENLKDYPNVPFYPIVAFTTNSDLKVNVTSEVVYTINLLKAIKKHQNEVITDKIKDKIHTTLSSANIQGKDLRKKHVNDIREKKNKVQSKNDSNTCPNCGSNLLLKRGKYGSYKGCSNYPSCKYTLKYS